MNESAEIRVPITDLRIVWNENAQQYFVADSRRSRVGKSDLDEVQDRLSERYWREMMRYSRRLQAHEVTPKQWADEMKFFILVNYLAQWAACNGGLDKDFRDSMIIDNDVYNFYLPHIEKDFEYIDAMMIDINLGRFGSRLEYGNFVDHLMQVMLEE